MSFFSKKNENVEREVPRVIFESIELEARVGLWSEVLLSDNAKKLTNTNFYDYLSNGNWFKRITIPRPLLNDIEKEFGSILARAGVDKSETCYLYDLDIDNFSFKCHLDNADRDAKISLRWGDPIDEPAHFTYEDQDVSSTYEYFNFRDDRPSELNLNSYTINNGEKAFKRDLWGHAAYFMVADDQYNLSIAVTKPSNQEYSRESFLLENESELQDYLLGISLPVDISELYKKLRDTSLGDISNYPEILIRTKDHTNDDKIVDEIVLKNGVLQTYTTTKNGRTISIDKKGNWKYDSPKLSIGKTIDGKVDYKLNMDSYDELVANLSNNQFVPVSEEVSEVKQLVKSLFN